MDASIPLTPVHWRPAHRIVPSRFPPVGLWDRIVMPLASTSWLTETMPWLPGGERIGELGCGRRPRAGLIVPLDGTTGGSAGTAWEGTAPINQIGRAHV